MHTRQNLDRCPYPVSPCGFACLEHCPRSPRACGLQARRPLVSRRRAQNGKRHRRRGGAVRRAAGARLSTRGRRRRTFYARARARRRRCRPAVGDPVIRVQFFEPPASAVNDVRRDDTPAVRWHRHRRPSHALWPVDHDVEGHRARLFARGRPPPVGERQRRCRCSCRAATVRPRLIIRCRTSRDLLESVAGSRRNREGAV